MDELAAQYGFTYEVAKADIDEKAIRHDDARQLVLQLAHAKAAAIAAKLRAAQGGSSGSNGSGSSGTSGLLVTCDQVGGHWVCHGAVQSLLCCCCSLLLFPAAAPCCCSLLPNWRLLHALPLQVVLHEGQILEKPEDEAQVGCRCCAVLGWAGLGWAGLRRRMLHAASAMAAPLGGAPGCQAAELRLCPCQACASHIPPSSPLNPHPSPCP